MATHPPDPLFAPVAAQGGTQWLDVTDPEEADMQRLIRQFHFHELDAQDCLSRVQRPKVDDYDSYLFIVLHLPVISQKSRRIQTEELDIFIGPGFVITVHDGALPPLTRLRERLQDEQTAKELLGQGSGHFLYRVLSELFEYCFPIVDQLTRKANQLERDVFDAGGTQSLVRDILLLKRNIITLRRIMQPQRAVVAALEHKHKKFLPRELEVYFDDIVDQVERIWTLLDSLKEVADSLGEANEGFISHTTGHTIRALTALSVIVLPLTFITGLLGMNVAIPLEEHPLAFPVVSAVLIGIAAALYGIFRWRGWL